MNSSKLDESSHLCVFCLRKADSIENPNDVQNDLLQFKAFTTMLDRFVANSNKGEGITMGKVDLGYLLLGCCKDCLIITKGFCEVYHQFKCLELKLEWKVLKLVQIMKLANKLPSRIEQLNSTLERRNAVKALRLKVIKTCNNKLSRCQPRVLLRKNKLLTPLCFQSSTNLLHDNVLNDNESVADFEPEDNLDPSCHDEDDHNDANNCTLKTINKLTPQEPNFSSPLLPALEIENIILPSMPVHKSEPLNETKVIIPSLKKEIKTEVFDTTPVSSNSHPAITKSVTLTTKQRYNLRVKNKVNYLQENCNDEYLPTHNSASSSSETSSDDIDSDDETILKERLKKPCRKIQICNLDDCNKRFKNDAIYQNHLKLHSNGSFTCNFCSTVKTNLINLSTHELEMHSNNQKNLIESNNLDNGFNCPRCSFQAIYSSDYQAHFAHVHFSIGDPPPKRQKCEKCDICSKKVLDKSYHSKTWHDSTTPEKNKLKTCDVKGCKAYFLRDWQLQSHYEDQHKNDRPALGSEPLQKSTFQCYICLKKFPQSLQLLRHKRFFHKLKRDTPTTQTTSNLSRLTCKFCPEVKDNPTDLAIHEADFHSFTETQGNSKTPNRCPRCPYKYLRRNAYITHYFGFHLNSPENLDNSTICKMCTGGNVYKLNSIDHFKTFHEIKEGMETHKCNKCPAYFRKSLQLQMHKIWVHQQDNKCEFCGKTFKWRKCLQSHLKIMHKEMVENPDLPFGCEINEKCKKRFGTKGELDYHQKYGHQKIFYEYKRKKKFICDKCKDDKDFGTRTNLDKHLALVHGNRPFVCEECGKACKTTGQLKLHVIFHKGPEGWKFECTVCGKKCATKQKLNEHGRTHTKEKPFVCQFCGEKYSHRHNWRSHLKGKHGNEKGVEEDIGKESTSSKGNNAKRKGSKKRDCSLAK